MSEKQNQAWGVAFAVFCGGFCGMVVGQYLAEQLPNGWGGLVAWAACVVTGGMLGYVLVDPVGFIAKIPDALRTAWRECWKSASLWPRCAHVWKYKGTWLLVLMSNVSWFVCVCALKKGPIWLPEDQWQSTLVEICWFFHSMLCTMAFPLLGNNKTFPNDEDMKSARVVFAYWGNPICFVCIVIPALACCAVVGIWRSLVYLSRKTPFLLRFVCRFFWHLYCLTHTNARLIAMADAALSAGVAFFAHSIALGLLILMIGAVWGVVNYLFIAPYLVPRVEPLLIKEG